MIPALGLALLAPLVAEYLLGNIPPTQLPAVVFLIPLYGGGAVLIREVTRRTGRGWPTVLLLGAAYGLFQAGLVDQSLFNASFLDGFDLQAPAHVPWLGVSAYYALGFVGGHAVWSIGVPIVLVESLVPGRRTTPWLGRVGLMVTAVGFLLGCALIYDDQLRLTGFLASLGQRVGTLAVVVVGRGSVAQRPAQRSRTTTPCRWCPGPSLSVWWRCWPAALGSRPGELVGRRPEV
jgi:hypothetical protein